MVLNTNTPRTTRNAPELKAVEKEPSTLERLTTLVNYVARSKEYGTLRRSDVPHTEAFKGATDLMINDPDNGFNTLDESLLRVTASLGTFMEAQEELSAKEYDYFHNEHGRLPQADYNRTQELKHSYIIPFNHELKSLINESPNTEMSDMVAALSKTYVAVYGRYNALKPTEPKDPAAIIRTSEVMYRIKQATNGMRHEVAAETMLSAAGIEYEYEVTVDEDARGTDIVVFIDGKREPLDIKASFFGEDKAREKRASSRAIWTELSDEDFRGMSGNAVNALSIPFDVATYHADSFVERIRTIIKYSNEHKESLSRKIARSARH